MSNNGATVLRILVVEDNDDCAESLATLLKLYGHEVEIAADGIAALEMASKCDPDVVLLDIGLPRMDGYHVARQLSSARPQKTPFLIAMTGYGAEKDRQESSEVGIDLHLLKPVNPLELQAILERFQRVIGGYCQVGGNCQNRAQNYPATRTL